jgi:uncharacterized OB-fold protein
MPAAQYAREIAQRYRFEAARCRACEKMSFPPRAICSSCKGEDFDAVTLPDEGTLVTWTVIRAAPKDFALQAPYVIAIVELAGKVRVTAQIVDSTPAELHFGSRLRRVLRRLRSEGEDGIIHYAYKFVLCDD